MFKRNKDTKSFPPDLVDKNRSYPTNEQKPAEADDPADAAIEPPKVEKSAMATPFKTHGISSSQPSSSSEGANLHVGRGLKLEGKIESCDSLTIEGDVKATIQAGLLKITKSGAVNGEAQVNTAEIDGTFDGDLTVKECLTVHATGKVTGKITYGELQIERGGEVSGEIQSAGVKPKASADEPSKQSAPTAGGSSAPGVSQPAAAAAGAE